MTDERLIELRAKCDVQEMSVWAEEILLAAPDITEELLRARATISAIQRHPLIAQLRAHRQLAGRWPTIERRERESFLAIIDDMERV